MSDAIQDAAIITMPLELLDQIQAIAISSMRS